MPLHPVTPRLSGGGEPLPDLFGGAVVSAIRFENGAAAVAQCLVADDVAGHACGVGCGRDGWHHRRLFNRARWASRAWWYRGLYCRAYSRAVLVDVSRPYGTQKEVQGVSDRPRPSIISTGCGCCVILRSVHAIGTCRWWNTGAAALAAFALEDAWPCKGDGR